MYVLLTRPTALSNFVLYYMFYVYIFSCLFLGPTYVRPIHVRITYTFYLYAPTYPISLCPYIIRITYTYYLCVLFILYMYISTYMFYLPALYLYVLLIRITYTLYLYILLIRYTYTSNLHVILTCSTYNIMCIPTLLSLHFFRPISQKFFLKISPKFFSK